MSIIKKEYTFDGKIWLQQTLKIGQYRQIISLLEGIEVPDNLDAGSLLLALKDKIHLALAIILNPEGISLKDKNIDELALELEFTLYPEDLFMVLNDFFDCNDLTSLLKNLNQTIENITKKATQEEPSLNI
jgi:hypothetical protein